MLYILKDLSLFNLHKLDQINNLKTKSLLVVCPNPDTADQFRNTLEVLKIETDCEVLTISKYLKDELAHIQPALDLEVYSKWQLMLILALVWKKLWPGMSANDYLRSFQIFTELRSYSLEIDVFDDYIKELDRQTSSALQVFWKIVEDLGYIDEQTELTLIRDFYKKGYFDSDESSKKIKQVMFYGFTYLAGNQIDLVNALSINNDVYFPISSSVLEESQYTDWIQWLDRPELLSCEEETEKSIEIRYKNFERGHAREFFSKQNIENYPGTFIMGSKKLDLDVVNLLPFKNLNFKVPFDIFEDIATKVLDEIEAAYFKKTDVVKLDIIKTWIDQEKEAELKLPHIQKNFRRYKILNLCEEVLDWWCQQSNQTESFSLFDFQIFKKAVKLNLPRTSILPLMKGGQNSSVQVKSLSDADAINREDKIYLVISSDFQSINLGEGLYDEKALQVLTSIGPVKRPTLGFLFLQAKIRSVLDYCQCEIWLEKGILETNQAWKNILARVKLEEKPVESKSSQIFPSNFRLYGEKAEAAPIESISASRLQAYIDCPQKYYAQYVQGNIPQVNPKLELMARQLGTIEHKIIEEYFKSYRKFDDEKLWSVFWKVWNRSVARNKLNLDLINFEKTKTELFEFSRNAIVELQKLLDFDSSIKYFFEKPFENTIDGLKYLGRADLIVEGEEFCGIIDFKRSSSSVPSFTSILEKQKIQLAFYSQHLNEIKPLMFWCYLNLKESSSSLLIAREKNIESDLIKPSRFLKNCKVRYFKDPDSFFSEYQAFEKLKVSELKENTSFEPKPRESSVCQYCPIVMLCNQGEA